MLLYTPHPGVRARSDAEDLTDSGAAQPWTHTRYSNRALISEAKTSRPPENV